MAVAIASQTDYVNSTSTATHTITKPASVASGDLLVLLFGGSTQVTFSDLQGFTEIGGQVDTTQLALRAAYKVADGTEGASFAFVFSGGCRAGASLLRITGQHATPLGNFGFGYNLSSTTLDSPSETVTQNNSLLLSCVADADGTASAYTQPTGMTMIYEANSGTTGTARTDFASASLAVNSGATGAKTWTRSTTGEWSALSVVIEAVAAGGGNIIRVSMTGGMENLSGGMNG